jgi:hypothetical protein
MPFILSDGLTQETLAGRNIYLDNDFLSVLLEDAPALKSLVELSQLGYLVIDPNTRFEFLRNVFLPQRRKLLEEFIDDDDIFARGVDHQTIFSQLRENAIILSYLYAQNGCTSASMVDLMLAALMLKQNPRSWIITGNRRDFPGFIFDIVGVLNYEPKNSNQIRAYSILSFSKEKYEKARENFERLG